MKHYLSLPLLALALLATQGCNTPATVGVKTDGPQVKADLMVMPADQAHYYTPPARLDPDPTTTEAAPANTTASVLTPGEVEAHPVARYVDPADKNLMHERHVVYRRAPAKWKLQAQPSQQIIVGPTLSSTQDRTPIQTQEADSFLREQRAINLNNQRALEALLGATQSLQQAEVKRRLAESDATAAAAVKAKPAAAASVPPATSSTATPPATKAEAEDPTKKTPPAAATPAASAVQVKTRKVAGS